MEFLRSFLRPHFAGKPVVAPRNVAECRCVKLHFFWQVSASDLRNVNMIAFRHVNQFEITGNVVTDRQFLSTLKVGRPKT